MKQPQCPPTGEWVRIFWYEHIKYDKVNKEQKPYGWISNYYAKWKMSNQRLCEV